MFIFKIEPLKKTKWNHSVAGKVGWVVKSNQNTQNKRRQWVPQRLQPYEYFNSWPLK